MDISKLTDNALIELYFKEKDLADELWLRHESPLLMRHMYAHVLEITQELKRRGIYDSTNLQNRRDNFQ